MAELAVREIKEGVVFAVKVVPGSSRTAMSGLFDNMIKIKISAPAQKNKANQRLCEFLAKKLGVKKKSVSIISGQTNPVKQVKVLGISAKMLLEKLNLNNQRA